MKVAAGFHNGVNSMAVEFLNMQPAAKVKMQPEQSIARQPAQQFQPGQAISLKEHGIYRPPEPEREQQQAPQSSYDPNVYQRLGTALASGIEAPGLALSKVLELLGEPASGRGSIREDIKQKLGVNEEQLKPRGNLEAFGQKFLQAAPTAGLGGGAGLISAAVGSVTGAAAERMGAPEWVQDLAQLGGEIFGGYAQGKIPTIAKSQNKAYELTRSLFNAEKDVPPSASALIPAFTQLRDELGLQTDKGLVKGIQEATETVLNWISKGKIDPNKALALRTNINAQARMARTATEKHYFNVLSGGLNNFFASYAATNPQYYDALNKADQFTMLKHMGSTVTDFINKFPLGKLIGHGLQKPAAEILGKVVGGGEKFVRRIVQSPVGRQHYFDVVKAIGENSPQLVIKGLDALASTVKREEQDKEFNFAKRKPSGNVKFL